ncbi:putative hydrolase of alkaline phosphatase superfamily [Desulfomonile tiedjei DSM 6799]|uniref:Putative hydrolase of alkaline phosphatase superfamily n=1 Tax=Desulfomonile tiedjei (strain ATCC 49306 / DSM 6799 / DCB-1) TaxID=706587 RepID=I4C698_DESTA|nr:putative hydrolase of alkaline phosphatase superfamily [Desulfomonile tiedjei DSM 6799]
MVLHNWPNPIQIGMTEKSGSDSNISVWALIYSFGIFTAFLFLIFVEWERYSIAAGTQFASLNPADQIALAILLLAKTLAILTPSFLICEILLLFKFTRASKVFFSCSLIVVYYFMICDLVLYGFAGYHVFDPIFYFIDMLRSPDQKIWQWAGDKLNSEVGLVLLIFTIGVPLCFLCFEYFFKKIPAHITNCRLLRPSYSLAFLLSFVVIMPTVWLKCFNNKPCLDRFLRTLPLLPDWREVLEHMAFDEMVVIPSAHADIDRAIPRPDASTTWRDDGSTLRDGAFARLFNPLKDSLAMKVFTETVKPSPVDVRAKIEAKDLPNIALIIFESLRPDAVSPEGMKEIHMWAEGGLRLENHFSGSNCSHLGLFSLFYGRNASGYDQTLENKIPPQMLHSLRRSGYEITFLTSGEVKGFRRVDKFLNTEYCDNVVAHNEYLNGMNDWPDSDRRKLRQFVSIMNARKDRPQFVFFYLVSSHYGYAFPPEFQIHDETPSLLHFFDLQSQVQNHKNRYANSLLFLQSELLKSLNCLDPNKTVVVLTADHGESMGEDGVFTHGSRMSDVQMRVPCIMVGSGIAPQEIKVPTTHADVFPTLFHAIAGKHVPIDGCQGRDLLEARDRPNEIAVAPSIGPGWEGFMIIRDNERILCRTKTKGMRKPVIEFDGIMDEFGQYELKMGLGGTIRYGQ